LPEWWRSKVEAVTSEPLPAFPFRHAGHDRLGHRRGDDEFLTSAWGRSSSRVLVIRDSDLAVTPGTQALRFVSPAEAPPGQRMLLGAVDGTVYFLVLADPDAELEGDFVGLRHLATTLESWQASLAVHAVSLAGWHQRHPRCSVCGAQTAVARAGETRSCPECGAMHFPRTDPAVIMLVTDEQDRCLLGHNSARVASWYSTLAGFVEPGESPEQAVVREVYEEVGVEVEDVTYAGSQPWPFPSSLMLGFFARATTTEIRVDGDEITQARWFTREQLRKEVEAGQLVLPTTISIAGSLITSWYGAELPPNRPT
jgi:NAD+ diphosphatase